MKKFTVILIAMFAYTFAVSQSLSVFNILPYGFPETKANFFAFDANDNLIFNLSPNDFEIYEDGKKAEVLSVNCGEGICVGGPYSAILSIDISGSTRGQKLPDEKIAAEIFIDMLPEGQSECAIVGFNHKNYLVNDFSTDKTQLKNSFESMTSRGGTNFNAALIDPLNGALLVAERAKYSKRVILVTDGMSDGDEQAIIKKANELKAKIFVVIINGESNEFIDAITSMTGGFTFFVSNTQEATSVFRKLSGISGCSSAGCEIVWKSEPTCNEYRNVTFKLNTNTTQTTTNYKAYSNSRIVTSVSPSSFVFERIPFGSKDTTVTFSFKNDFYPVQIKKISNTSPAYTVIDYGGSYPPFTMGTGEQRTITVKYKPQVDTVEFGNIIIEKEYCGNHTISFLSYDPMASDSIVVISPNGNEKLLAGSDTLITWLGNPADSVTIEYSIDAGKTWTSITNNAKGLSYKWKIPDVVSDSCLIRVYRDDNPDNLVDGAMFGLGSLWCLDISPDGSTFITAGSSGCIYIWDATTYNIIDTLCEHKNYITNVKFSPDGTKIFSSDYQMSIIWDVYTKSIDYTISATALAWSPDGNKIATKNSNNLIIIDSKMGLVLDTLFKHNDNINCIDWSSDGKFIISGSADSTIVVWDYESSYKLLTFHEHDGEIASVSINNNSTKIISSSNNSRTAIIWELKSGNILAHTDESKNGTVENIVWSSDGKQIAACASIWDESGKLLINNEFPWSNSSVVWFPDNKSFLSGSVEALRIYYIDDNTDFINLDCIHDNRCDYVEWNTNIQKIVSSNWRNIKVWNIKERNHIINKDFSLCRETQWSPDNSRLSTDFQILETKDFQKLFSIPSTHSHSWSSDGSKIIGMGYWDSTITIYNSIDGEIIQKITDPLIGDVNYGMKIRFSPDGKKIAWSRIDSSIIIIDANTLTEIYLIKSLDFRIRNFEWDPTSKKIALFCKGSYEYYGNIKVYDIDLKTQLIKIDSIEGNSLAWSPDGLLIAITNYYRGISLFETSTFKFIRRIGTWKNDVISLSWHSNSKWITGGSDDGTVRIFRVIDPPGDSSDTCFSIIKPKLSADSIDMLQLCANSTEPEEITKDEYLKNNDIFAITIDSIRIEGTDTIDFQIIPKNLNATLQPNTSLKVKFSFHPKTPGIKSADIVIYTNYGTIRKSITGEALDCNIQNIAPQFNFEKICFNDTADTLIAVMYNSGMSISTIDSTVALGPDTTQFKIIIGGGGFNIAPSDTHRIRVEYKPIKVGISTCQFAFYHKGINSPEIVTFQGQGIKCELQAGTDQTITLTKPCEILDYKEELFTVITNNQKTDAKIDSLVFAPADNVFKIVENLTYPFILKSGEIKQLTIRYTPKDTAKVCSKLKIFHDNTDTPKEMTVCGISKIYKWSIEQDTIKSYNMNIGVIRQEKFTIKNLGNLALYWANPPIKFTNNNFTITSISPNPTPVSGISEVTIDFVGEAQPFNSMIVLKNECATQDSIKIYSINEKIQILTLKSDTLETKPLEKIKLPFYLTAPANNLMSNFDGIYTEIAFNSTVLFASESEDIKIISEENDTENSTKRLRLFLPKKIFSGEKLYLEMNVALGNSDFSVIHFTKDSTYLAGFSDGYLLTSNDGLVNIDVCEDGGKRLLIPSGKIQIQSIKPNPADNFLEVVFELIEKSGYKIKIINSIGQTVKELIKENSTKGIALETIDISNLSSGAYILTLETQSESITTTFMILK